MPSAIVSDLDDTLWTNDGALLHPSTRAAIAELRRRGVPLLWATGRRVRVATARLAAHDLLGPAVLLGGAVGADLDTGREWHRQAFGVDAGRRVLRAFLAEGLSPVVHVSSADVDAVIAPDCPTSAGHRAQFDLSLVPTDPAVPVEQGVAVGFGLLSLEGAHAEAAHRVAAAITDDAHAICGPDTGFGGTTIMVSPHGVTKVTGISRWTRAQGLDPSEVLVVGDGLNDVEMLAWAGRSVAVEGSAAAEVGTDHVIAGPAAGGWADVLDLLDA